MDNTASPIVVVVSGGFDPLHIGHVRLIQEARSLGDELVILLNNDNWLKLKKGGSFMNEAERKEILEAIEGVDRVVLTKHSPDTADISVCEDLRELRPHKFVKGGDRKPDGDPIPEVLVCDEIGCEVVYNVGHGGKVQSSSWLTAKDRETRECFCGSGLTYGECHGKMS